MRQHRKALNKNKLLAYVHPEGGHRFIGFTCHRSGMTHHAILAPGGIVQRMISALRNRGIKTQLMILIMIATVFVILIQSFNYWLMSDTISSKNDEYLGEFMNNVGKTAEANMNEVNRILTSTAYNDTIQQYLLEEDPLEKYVLHQKIQGIFEKIIPLNPSIKDFVLIGNFGSEYNVSYEPATRETYQSIIERMDGSKSGTPYIGLNQLYFNDKVNNYIVAAIPVWGIESGLRYGMKIGYMFMLLDPRTIIPQVVSDKSGEFFILDRDGIIISSSSLNAGIGEKWDQNKFRDAVIRTKSIPISHFKLVSVIPKSELYRGLDRIRKVTYILVGILILLMFGTYKAIGNNIITPIRTFGRFVNELRGRNEVMLKDRIQLEGYAEIKLMAAKFNQLLDELGDVTQQLLDSNSRVYELELLKKQAELAFLNSQINPHFLYNTLECIQGIAAVKGVTEIQRMTAALSQIFRYSIKGDHRVRIEDEMKIVKHYLSIQQVRFHNRFDVHYDIPEELLTSPIQKMVLQPIVENAIFHGIELKLTKGNLWISGSRNEQGDIEISIKDDGVGMSEQRLKELQQRLNVRSLEHGEAQELGALHRIGISNVNLRLKMEYGHHYGITITSLEQVGTEVILTLPRGQMNDERFLS